VAPVNDPPEIKAIPDVEVWEDVPYFVDVSPYISDVDSPKETLTLEVDSMYVEVTGQGLNLTYPEGIEFDELDVQVYDGEYYSNTSLIVWITPVNDAPYWVDSDKIEITAVEDEPGEFDLNPYLGDVDTPDPKVILEVDSLYGRVEGDKFFKFTYPDGVLMERVTFTLNDGEFKVALEVDVTITPVNDAPELTGPRDVPATGASGIPPVKFTVTFKDIDMEGETPPAVKVVIDDEEYDCEGDGTNYKAGVTFTYTADLSGGEHTYKFIADDGAGGTAETEEKTFTLSGGGADDDVVDDDVVDDDDDSSSSTMMVVGMGVGVFVLLIIIVVVIIVVLLVLKGKKKPEEQPPGPPALEGEPEMNTQQMGAEQYPPYGGQQDMYGQQQMDPYAQQEMPTAEQPQMEGMEQQQGLPAQQEMQYLPPAQDQPQYQDPNAAAQDPSAQQQDPYAQQPQQQDPYAQQAQWDQQQQQQQDSQDPNAQWGQQPQQQQQQVDWGQQ